MNFKIRKPYKDRVSVVCDCSGFPSLTHQSFKDECDINRILHKYRKTGLIDHVNRYQGQYGDFSEVESFQDALQIVQDANEAFYTLPSELRKELGNDPAAFLDFVKNPENTEKMRSYGLLPPIKPTVDSPGAAPGASGVAASGVSGSVTETVPGT